MIIYIFLSLLLCSLSAATISTDANLPVVQNFSVDKYMGHWYMYGAISSIVDFFCVCAQTNYVRDATNSSIVNFDEYCRVGATWAPIVHSKSYGEVDPVESAKWINVNPIVGSLAARADYYIIFVGDNYEWSVVGSRNRNNLYILTREKTLDDAIYNKLLEKAKGLGFDVTKVEKTNQSCADFK